MSPIIHKKIAKAIQEHQLKSITVDVFDTLLLHDYWPADLRYYDISVRWLPSINRLISPDITTYELYNERIAAKHALDNEKLSSRIDIWFDILIDALCDKYNTPLSEAARFELLASLMAVELEFEAENTKPNSSLLKQLTTLKQQNPDLKFYFIADSHLMSEQLKTLFKLKQIDLFDGGVSSADYNKTKASGELYEQLTAEFGPDFDLSVNIHIGDRRDPDFLAPRQHDSLAIHYRPIRLRGLRTLVGRTWFICLRQLATHRTKKPIKNLESYTTWYNYGAITSEIHRTWSKQVSQFVKVHDHSEILVSGELATITKPQLANLHYVHLAPELTKANMLRAFIWLLAACSTEHWDAERLLALLMQQENLSRVQLYQLCFASSYAYTEFAINSFGDQDFAKLFLQELLSADKTFSEPARQAYAQIAQLLPKNDKSVFILQSTNDNMSQIFSNFAHLHNIHNQVNFVAFDHDNSISSSQTPLFNLLNTRRENLIVLGSSESASWHHELAPAEYYQKILLPAYRRTVNKILKTAA